MIRAMMVGLVLVGALALAGCGSPKTVAPTDTKPAPGVPMMGGGAPGATGSASKTPPVNRVD